MLQSVRQSISINVSVSVAAFPSVSLCVCLSVCRQLRDISAWEMRNFCLFNANAFRMRRQHAISFQSAWWIATPFHSPLPHDLLRTCCTSINKNNNNNSCKSLCNFCIFSWCWPPKWCQQLSTRWLMSYSSGNVFHLPSLPPRGNRKAGPKTSPSRFLLHHCSKSKKPTKRLCQRLTNWPSKFSQRARPKTLPLLSYSMGWGRWPREEFWEESFSSLVLESLCAFVSIF